MPKGVHDGHRRRLTDRFLKTGLESFEDHQVLELMLFYTIPRKDTNELAHLLLKEFGSLSAVLEASIKELCRVDGIGPHSASLINFCGQLLRRYYLDKRENVRAFTSIEQIGEYLRPLFLNEKNEKTIIVCVNNRWELLGCVTLSVGTITTTDLRTREVMEAAFEYHATGIILAHNHPAGFATPSEHDLLATRKLIEDLRPAEVYVLDHLIFSANDYTSMRQSPHYAPLFHNLPSS